MVFLWDGHFGGKLRLPVPTDRADALPHRRIKEAGSARRLDRLFAADADAVHIIVPQRPKPTGLHRAARADALLLPHLHARRGDGHRPFTEAMFVRLGGIVGARIVGAVGVRVAGVRVAGVRVAGVRVAGLYDAARVVVRRRFVAGGKDRTAKRQQNGQQ